MVKMVRRLGQVERLRCGDEETSTEQNIESKINHTFEQQTSIYQLCTTKCPSTPKITIYTKPPANSTTQKDG